jgi:hypothetical protein
MSMSRIFSRRRFLFLSTALCVRATSTRASDGVAIRRMIGPVFVNNRPVSDMTPIDAGDLVAAANGAEVDFVVGPDAFHINGRTLVRFLADSTSKRTRLHLIAGTLYASFAERRRDVEIILPGGALRSPGGTLLVQVGGPQVYICLCRGAATLVIGNEIDSWLTTSHEARLAARDGEHIRVTQVAGGRGHDTQTRSRLEGYTRS